MTTRKQANYENLKFHLWIGDEPIYDNKTCKLVGYNRPQPAVDFCYECWRKGKSPLQTYLASQQEESGDE